MNSNEKKGKVNVESDLTKLIKKNKNEEKDNNQLMHLKILKWSSEL